MKDHEEHDQIAELVRLAGKAPVVAHASHDAIKSAVHSQWRRSATTHMWKRRVYLSVASILLAVGALLLAHQFLPGPVPLSPVGLVENLSGDVSVHLVGARPYFLTPNHHVLENSRLVSGESARLLLRLLGGATVRIDTNTTLVVHSSSRFTLEDGVAYFDSGRRGSHFSISTAVGIVTNNGTQFEVRMHQDTMRVRVREGSVIVQRNGSHKSADAGMEVVMDRSGVASIVNVPKYGSQWNWISEVPPVFQMEGRPLMDLLRWVARENGWILRFATADLYEASGSMILHGSIAGLRPELIPGVVLPVCGLNYSLKDGILTVTKMEP